MQYYPSSVVFFFFGNGLLRLRGRTHFVSANCFAMCLKHVLLFRFFMYFEIQVGNIHIFNDVFFFLVFKHVSDSPFSLR